MNTQRNPIKSFCKERQHIFFSERYVLLCSKALHKNKHKGLSMRILSMLSKVNFYIGRTTCDILINRLSTKGPLKLPCVIRLVFVIDVMGCHEIPGKSWWGWNQCWLTSLSCTYLSSPHISKLIGEFCRFQCENSFCISGHSMSTRLVYRSTTLLSFVVTKSLISLSIL
jgi:hypothetical protein